MRPKLAAAVASVIASASEPPVLTKAESLVLVRAANLATKARTAVEVDYQGNVEDRMTPRFRPGSPSRLSFVLYAEYAEIVVSPWPGFTSDLVYLRCIMRLAFAWPKPTAVVRITGVIPGGLTVHGAGGFGSPGSPAPYPIGDTSWKKPRGMSSSSNASGRPTTSSCQ